MNDLAVIKEQQDTFQLARAWVRAGLNQYIRSLESDINSGQEVPGNDIFPRLNSVVLTQWQDLSGRTGRLVRTLNLTPEELFVTMLAGLAETDPPVTFALSELQQPDSSGQLSVHLALDMLQSLFDDCHHWDVLNLTHTPLTASGVLSLEGDGPLPLQALTMNLNVWAVLKHQARPWPETQFIKDQHRHLLPEATRRELPALCSSSQQTDFLILRGHPQSGRHILAGVIAQLGGRTAVQTPFKVWQQQPEFQLACVLADWTPVISVSPAPGESVVMAEPGYGVRVTLIATAEAAIHAPASLQYLMPLPQEQQRFELWLQGTDNSGLAKQLAGNALLSGPVIADLLNQASLAQKHTHSELTADLIRRLRFRNSDGGLSQLAQAVDRQVPDNAVVFPPLINDHLRDLIHRAVHRESLWQQLGSSLNASQNPGLRALFVGESGTGKTLAASYIASQLGSPLYRVDLGSTMNKYIGETEKNLGRMLDHAAAVDAILLFDEADSVFGNRTDPRSSGERFANNLTNYLLARIESHPGIVLLTTNHRDRIDPAFNRRLDIIIDFPQPGFQERLQLWESHLGKRSPGIETLRSFASHCDLTGGQIRNAVLTAAANETGPGQIPARILVQAIGREYQKLGRALPSALQNSGS